MSEITPHDTLKDSRRPEADKKPIPRRWKPPQSLVPRLIFRTMCFCLTFHSDLDFMWEIFRKPNGWENFHIQYLTQINQLSTVQGLVLTTVAVFISTPPPLRQINYAADGPYTLLSESLVFSLFGLLLQLFTSVVGQTYQKQNTFKAMKRSRWRFLCHIIVLSIPVYLFGISLLLLIFAISVTGFLSSSISAQIFTGATFAVLFICLFVSILPSPFFSQPHEWLSQFCKKLGIGKSGDDNGDDDDDDDDDPGKARSEEKAGGPA